MLLTLGLVTDQEGRRIKPIGHLIRLIAGDQLIRIPSAEMANRSAAAVRNKNISGDEQIFELAVH